METILVVAYIAFAIYSGYKVVSGRFEFLERQAPLNMIIKFIVCSIVGYFIAAFYLIYLAFILLRAFLRF